MNIKKNILPKNGEAFLFNHFFTFSDSDRLFKSLLQNIQWQQDYIKMYGKKIPLPRLTAWYGEKPYTYSGIKMQPHPWNDNLLEIKEKIDKESNVIFNSVLLNRYQDETNSIGWHQDNEHEFGINPVIGSISFGSTRTFRFRHLEDYKKNKQKKIKTIPIEIDLTHGSFLLMRGETQHKWEHEIKKISNKKKDNSFFSTKQRINLTFRVIKD